MPNIPLANHPPFLVDFTIQDLDALKIHFKYPLSDIDAMANNINVFQNLLIADIETLAHELQIEMISLHCSNIFKEKYIKSLLEFDKSLFPQFGQVHKFSLVFFFCLLQNEIYRKYFRDSN